MPGPNDVNGSESVTIFINRPIAGVEWFNLPVTKDSLIANTAGTLSADACSRFGRIGVSADCTISAIHLHYDHPAGTGNYSVEVYRLRGWVNPVITLIATCTDDGTDGDFHTTLFDFESEALKDVLAGDYLTMQVLSTMTGTGSKNAVAFVDVHFNP